MFKVYIDEQEVIISRNFSIKEEFLNTSSVILNNVYPANWEVSKDYVNNFYVPKSYTRVDIYKDEKLYFCGFSKNSGNLSLNPRYPKFATIQALDFKTLLTEGKNLDFVIKDKTVKEAIEKVIDSVSEYGFVVGNLNFADTSIIGAYSTLDQSAFDVLQYLSEISGTLWTTRIIDKDTTAIDFYDIEELEEDENVKYTAEYFEENNIVDMYFSFNSNDYRNKQEIISENVYSENDVIENVYANGYDNVYSMSQKIATINSLKVNRENKIVATESEKDLGIYADYYYTSNSNIFYKNEDLNIDSVGTKIEVNYTSIIKSREVVYDITESQRIATSLNRSGVITRYEDRNDLLIKDQLLKVAQTYLKFKGKVEVLLTIKTKDKDILSLGHKVKFDIDVKDLEFLSKEYLVKSKTIEVVQANEEIITFYTYELSGNFNAENSINYFDNQRRKAKGNIEKDEFVDRNIDIMKKIDIIFKDLKIEEIDIESDNILQTGLQVPLNN